MTRAPFAVVDVETTGFAATDRVCEIAIVQVSPDAREITGEFETLVNPQQHLGPTHIHQITERMVARAPTFAAVASGVMEYLNGSILVAHSLPFDARMLAQEFARMNGTFDAGVGVCTLQLTRAKLEDAAERYGIAVTERHRAIADARISAALLMRLFRPRAHRLTPARITAPNAPPCAPLVVRGT